MTTKLKLSLLITFSVAVLTANAQINILNIKKLAKIKNGKTYIMVNSVKFPEAEQYLEQAKKNWTLSKSIDFLPPGNESIINPDDSFLSLESLTESRHSPKNSYIISISYKLSFWICKAKYFRGKRKLLKHSDHEPVAEICLSIQDKAYDTESFFKKYDFDGGGLLYNWSPGMLGNYLGQLTNLLNAGKKITIRKKITNKTELAKLTKETLYVPDFNLIRLSAFVGTRSTPNDEEKVFEDYGYSYKVIRKDDLDKQIINSDNPFYYFLFIRYGPVKIFCVINSKTGETIYSRLKIIKFFSTNLKSGDLKDLYKEIGKP